MEILTTYTDGIKTINLYDLFNINGTMIMVKELFILNGLTYISYDVNDDIGLTIELVSKFINDKNDYFNTVISQTFNENKSCGCGCDEEH
jgi:spore germination protein GerM